MKRSISIHNPKRSTAPKNREDKDKQYQKFKKKIRRLSNLNSKYEYPFIKKNITIFEEDNTFFRIGKIYVVQYSSFEKTYDEEGNETGFKAILRIKPNYKPLNLVVEKQNYVAYLETVA